MPWSTCFSASCKSFEVGATRDHKEAVFAQRKSEAARLEEMLDVIDSGVLTPLREIRSLVEDETMPDAWKLKGISAILDRGPERVVDLLRADIRANAAGDGQYHLILKDRSLRLQNRLNPILKRITFTGDASVADLMVAIEHFRDRDGNVDAGMPLGFMTPVQREAVSNGPKGFRISLCKVFLLQHIAKAIKAGNLNLRGSYKYCPLDDFPDILPRQHVVPLSEVLGTVDHHCSMLAEFGHWQQTHVHQAPGPTIIIAGIMSLGCAIGVRKMARISHGITERGLEHVVNWRVSLDNIIAANDRVLAATERMELPQIHRKSQKELHTSSDGQKFEVRQPSLNASHSFKYFGQGQGVSAYTFIDERSLLWYSLVFSAAERESAYVIDGLMHNDVVQSNIHSTDEHGFSEAIFCVTHLLGLSYAPRFRNLKKQNLYHFRGRGRGDRAAGWMIAPTKYVNESAIPTSWDDLLRLVATIKLKEATASEIFRRLNSYSRQHSLYQAMKGLRPDHQVPVHPALYRRGRTAAGNRETTQQGRAREPFHPAPSQSEIHADSNMPTKPNRRSPKAATGSSETASPARTIST